MYKSYSFTAVNVVPPTTDNRQPVANNAPLPNGLSSNPQVVTLGADAVHTNVPDSGTQGSTTPEEKPKMPTWVWYVIAAVVVFFLLKK